MAFPKLFSRKRLGDATAPVVVVVVIKFIVLIEPYGL